MTSLTKEMLEMVPSTEKKRCGQHGVLVTVADVDGAIETCGWLALQVA
jgi:hypothetical protein